MNKIFKVIWSKSRNCYVVASELAKGTSKSTSTGRMAKRAALAAVAALLISPLGAGYVSAADDYVTVKDTNGTEQTVYTKDGVDTQLTDLAKQTQVSTNTNDIATNKANIETNQNNIATLQTQVSTNTNDIAT
ncbi:ESPR domain-containing protein, partial [uncultured Megasphaera sp.]|uniref:ESPR domain-containing protein n=1 Tax=uncultured Megasphaera sp. TaxID=165188 RepID=UPI0025E5E62D